MRNVITSRDKTKTTMGTIYSSSRDGENFFCGEVSVSKEVLMGSSTGEEGAGVEYGVSGCRLAVSLVVVLAGIDSGIMSWSIGTLGCRLSEKFGIS